MTNANFGDSEKPLQVLSRKQTIVHQFHQPQQELLNHLRKHTIRDSLASRIIGDVVIALGVTACVSPMLTVVDKAVVQTASPSSSHTSVASSAFATTSNMLHRPLAFLKSPTFLWMWMTYAVTYSAANVLQTLMEHRTDTAPSNDTKLPKVLSSRVGRTHATKQGERSTSPPASPYILFIGTTLVNSAASLVKDRAYAKLFGQSSAKGVPRITYALWMVRDFTVIGSSFVLPKYTTPMLADHFGWTHHRAGTIAQVGVPVLMQVVASPLHLIGLDCYNRRMAGVPWSQRVVERSKFLARDLRQVVVARMLRVLPGYGIAGVYNTKFRNQWKYFLAEQKQHQIRRTSDFGYRPRFSELLARIRS
ncbi:hypothetical protein MPSEU_000042600 [Mayamaea pseudoterrestris]|nr:hypothetical protein MPSEU_000042600 [Mayamaea pseudoterrestris]